jgi:hypothetical protein
MLLFLNTSSPKDDRTDEWATAPKVVGQNSTTMIPRRDSG